MGYVSISLPPLFPFLASATPTLSLCLPPTVARRKKNDSNFVSLFYIFLPHMHPSEHLDDDQIPPRNRLATGLQENVTVIKVSSLLLLSFPANVSDENNLGEKAGHRLAKAGCDLYHLTSEEAAISMSDRRLEDSPRGEDLSCREFTCESGSVRFRNKSREVCLYGNEGT